MSKKPKKSPSPWAPSRPPSKNWGTAGSHPQASRPAAPPKPQRGSGGGGKSGNGGGKKKKGCDLFLLTTLAGAAGTTWGVAELVGHLV